MTIVPTIALVVMAAADVITVLLLAALGVAALRMVRRAQAIMRGLEPDTRPIAADLRALRERMRTTADVARHGAQHAQASVHNLGHAAGHIRAMVTPPPLSRWGLMAGSKAGARAARKWYSKRRTA